MDCVRRVALVVNCGYARVSIYENSNPGRTGRYARQSIDRAKRLTDFKEQFSSTFCFPADFFTVGSKDTTQFDRDCDKILDGFKSKFPPGGSKETYLSTFSKSKWCGLPVEEKRQHSLSNSVKCFDLHLDSQQSFPLKPVFHFQPIVSVDQNAMQSLGRKKFTTALVTELNRVYEGGASTSFTDALVETKSSGLEKKRSKNDKRREKIKIQKEATKAVNQHFADKAAISMLTECESKSKYHRKRMAQSFHSPQELPQPKVSKSHSPSFSKVSWDTEKLKESIVNWPAGTTINWTKVAREHGVPGRNAGQVVKEFTVKQGIDTSHIATPKRKATARPRMRKLPGGEVSIPSNPSIAAVEANIRSMITSGRFTLGNECAPYTITKYILVDSLLTPRDLQIQGRKVPLKQLRQKLLKKQLKYMRLIPESAISTMTEPELTRRLNINSDGKSVEELRDLLRHAQKSRFLCMWHDHATILKMGFIMITVHVMYDPVVFYTDEEYQQLNPGAEVKVQAEVEQPEIHLVALGSSSVHDQAAIIGDRLSCILELSEHVKTDTGVEIADELRFFTGDHPAAQFEQGSKQGGTYKCGACGSQEQLFDDQAHALQHKWRSLQQLQTLATNGRFGRQPGVLQPFDLKVKALRSELEARGVVLDSKMRRADLQKLLDGILRGVSRVPALLLSNPTQQLASLNLEKYEIVASEPLHDIKGHALNLITELPSILPGDTKSKVIHLIDNCLAKEKKTGADLRRVIIQLYLQLKDLDCSSRILFLLQSFIKIGEIAYSRDDKRCPRLLLQLYNMCWIHMELCKDLLSHPEKITKSRMFGHYLHALTAHSPTQLELACLRSLNTESQERLFGQARRIGEMCTNHHPDNVIPQIMLRLQAKQEQREILTSVRMGDTQVSRVAGDLPQLSGTKVKTSFIQQREDSWQNHLQRISPFLVAGVGVWWSHTENGFLFHDGDTDRANPGESFSLFHHRYHSIKDVEQRRDACWTKIVDERIVIPSQSIKLYDSDGNKTGRLLYNDNTVTLEATTEAEAFLPSFLPEPSPLGSNVAMSLLPNEDLQREQSTGEVDTLCVPMASTDCSQASNASTPPCINEDPHEETQAEMYDVLVDEGSEYSAANTNSVAAEMSCSGASSISFINVNHEEHNVGLKTSAGNSIKLLLGCDDDLVKFDDLRFKLKKAKQAGNHMHMTSSISEYRQMVKKIETKVKSVQSERAAKLKELELREFQQSGRLPAKTPNSHYYNILKERNLASNILRIL